MNYYEHHIGDYAAATAHLSWDEDMAYTRLLRAYYHQEKGIPEGQQYRLARASTPAQRRAVDAVIAEFFMLVDGVHLQKRAEAEIDRFKDKQRKAKASANARWSQSERNANASPDAMRTHSEGNALQTPDTRHQSNTPPLTPPRRGKDAAARAACDVLPEVDPETLADWIAVRKAKRAGPITQTVADGLRREAAAAGMTPQDAVRKSIERGWQGFQAEWLKSAQAPADRFAGAL